MTHDLVLAGVLVVTVALPALLARTDGEDDSRRCPRCRGAGRVDLTGRPLFGYGDEEDE